MSRPGRCRAREVLLAESRFVGRRWDSDRDAYTRHMATRTPTRSSVYDTTAVNAAEAAVDAAIRATLHGGRSPRAVVVPAPAGAGKSHLTVSAVEEARRKGLRVVVAAPTNEQAFGFVRAIATRHCAGHPDR